MWELDLRCDAASFFTALVKNWKNIVLLTVVYLSCESRIFYKSLCAYFLSSFLMFLHLYFGSMDVFTTDLDFIRTTCRCAFVETRQGRKTLKFKVRPRKVCLIKQIKIMEKDVHPDRAMMW